MMKMAMQRPVKSKFSAIPAMLGVLFLLSSPILCFSFVTTTKTILSTKHQQQFTLFSSSSSSSIAEEEDAVLLKKSLSVITKLASEESTQTKLELAQVKEYNEAIDGLPDPPAALDVDGGWNLLATISPEAEKGDNVDFFDPNSWKNYIAGTGPSPFQSLVTGSSRVQGLTQWLTPNDFDNVVEFKAGPIDGKLVLKASLESVENNRRIFRFRRGFFLIKAVWGGAVTLPYPVPFNLLGDRAIGWLETIGYDEKTGFRAALGNKGTRFIFQERRSSISSSSDTDEEGEGEQQQKRQIEVPGDIVIASNIYASEAKHETDEEEREQNKGLTKRAVLMCPQQFGGKPGDYTVLTNELRQRGHPVYLARISALEWLSITKSVFTEAYFKGELEPSKALEFYMNSINKAMERINADTNGEGEFAILSHSIGGWVARAWLGEVANETTRKRCKKYVSLGTPHVAPPEDSLMAKADQTRGLLKYINDRWPGAYWDDIAYTCVASSAVTGKIGFDDGLDSILAFVSYFALIGQGDVKGDGITPVDGALLKDANSIVLDDVYHADVLPNPIGGTNSKLIETSWYANRIDEWTEAL